MDFNNSWSALLDPGASEKYFDVHGQTRFEADATDFSPLNAWWLAELSRLVYRRGPGETSAAHEGQLRSQMLASVGLQEQPIMSELAQAILIKPLDAAAPQFRILVFRGTDELVDWLTDLKALLGGWGGSGQVHIGFREVLETIWEQIGEHLGGDNSPSFYTGHSLGAALATLAAAKSRLAASNIKAPQAVYTYGSPLVGNQDFSAALAGVKIYRVVNNLDVVTTVPFLGFQHLGELHYVTHDGRIIVDPSQLTVILDRLKIELPTLFSREALKQLAEPPEFLADHAPVNYVAHLERAV